MSSGGVFADGVEGFVWVEHPVDGIGAGDGDTVSGLGSSFPSAEVAGAEVIGVVASVAVIGVMLHGLPPALKSFFQSALPPAGLLRCRVL